MFGWFRPTCPLATGEKVWVESRMAWLAQNLGMDRMLQAPVVEPTEEYFPDEYQGEDERRRANVFASGSPDAD